MGFTADIDKFKNNKFKYMKPMLYTHLTILYVCWCKK